MRRFSVVVVLFLVIMGFLNIVVGEEIYWVKEFKGKAYGVDIAPNGDIIVAGRTKSFGAGGYDIWILRLDENGNVKWQKTYGGSYRDWADAVAIAPNGDIIVAGYTYSFGAGGGDFWILRLDENGNVKWKRTYGGSNWDGADAVAIAPNGDIIVAGYTYSFGAGEGDFWILRLDENGNVKWQRTYGGSDDDIARAIAIASNEDIIVAGYTNSFGTGGKDIWILRLDKNGNVKWRKTYGGNRGDEAYAITIASNEDIIVAGYTNSFGTGGKDIWILRLDKNGNVKWEKTYGGSDDDEAYAVAIAPNGDVVVAGRTGSFGAGGSDFWILRLDENGNVKWEKTYGGSYWDEAYAITIAPNGNCIVGGDKYVIKFNIDNISLCKGNGWGDSNAIVKNSSAVVKYQNIIKTGISNAIINTSIM
ncbi:hypothetical protein CFE53_00390 [Methanofervidicoccus sp. A16]|uniref:hypothetical protein n=1 Tax=Methanofervidicoccus sp. A16 TaxID=2607662 RepID=UPI001188CD6E|nr:hypothetical protein [Methanofervidicoccus sp. A16]AXI24710.1 hypothetical protein CFE53_00390 [Methanofervidicoccus sp. A16]